MTVHTPLVEGLLRPEAYPHRPRRVRLVETHISYVFLAGPFAYKVKKPVNFGFLDYSTLEKRRHFCEQEVRLNQVLCPGTYLRVVPIVRTPSGLRVDGDGEPVEYAVLMRRLQTDRMLDRLVRLGRIDPEVLVRVARKVAEFHAASDRSPEIDRFGEPEVIRFNWEENFEQTAPYVGRTIPVRWYEGIRRYVTRFLEGSADLLRRRVVEGRVRDCHGDLRTESICVEDGICIFDRIEFNDRFRYGDVAAEVAFLAMDLDALGRPDLGYVFAESYIAFSGDRELRRLLPFYQCYRAYVRGKVSSFRLDQVEAEAERRRIRRLAHRYFRLAWDYARAPGRPVLVAVAGAPAEGGLVLARSLGCRLGAVVHPAGDGGAVRADLEAGFPVVATVPEAAGEDLARLAGEARRLLIDYRALAAKGEPPGRVLRRVLRQVYTQVQAAG